MSHGARIAVDAMGGDVGSPVVVPAAATLADRVDIFLVGDALQTQVEVNVQFCGSG